MRLPLSWLNEYVRIKESPEKLADDLLLSGTKVEKIEKVGNDTVFEFEITSNRPDCLSVIGIAREISAIYGRPLSMPSVFSDNFETISEEKHAELVVTEKKLCPYYSLGVIDAVKITPSPKWLSERLEKSGMRSLNNIIDITNYVMLETGQPMHAFDYQKIRGKMVLRSSKKGEEITTLDNVKRELPNGAIIIEDDDKIIDLAGIMGGMVSEVDKNTQTVALHVPVYNSLAVRLASQSIGLRSEASNRFEKKLDPNAHRLAFERALELIRTICSGKLVSKIESAGYPVEGGVISILPADIRERLGLTISDEEIKQILTSLKFSVKNETSNQKARFLVNVPSFRTDITQPVDLTEEVGRVYGYNNFPKTIPAGPLPIEELHQREFERKVKQTLVNLGLREVYTGVLTSALALDKTGFSPGNCLKVSNRLSLDYEYLRPSLIAGLLSVSELNAEHFESFSFFEIGRIFQKEIDDQKLPNQPKKTAAIFVNSDFSKTKGVLEALLKKLNIKTAVFSETQDVPPFGLQTAAVSLDRKKLGLVGQINPEVATRFGISARVFAFELDLNVLEQNFSQTIYQSIPKYPTVIENISLYLPDKIIFSQVEDAIKKTGGSYLYKLELIEDTRIRERRSILVRTEYYSPTHTLTKSEITKIRGEVLTKLKAIGAEPRVKEN